jgi:hypothetical protein
VQSSEHGGGTHVGGRRGHVGGKPGRGDRVDLVIRPDGTLRDTVMFSIIDREWPDVKAGLLRRLG